MVVGTAESWQLSQRRACRALGACRSTVRYVSVRPSQAPLRQRMHELASVRVCYGYRRLHVLLRREGWPVNRKRVYRLYREEGLCLRAKRPKRRRMAMARQARAVAAEPNQRWAMDFMSDDLHDGRRLRVLTVVDTCTRECVALEVRRTFRSEEVAAVLTRVGLERGLPAAISVDNGTEFTARALDHWAYTHRVELDYSRPGKPTDNAFIEAFNSLVRRECLSQHYFSTLDEARHLLEAWREEYNNHRPHGSLGDRTPAEYRSGGYYVPDRNRLALMRA
jgi:putative transposase